MNPVPVEMWHLIQETRQKMFAARRKVYTAPPPALELFTEFGITHSSNFIGSLPYMLSNYDRTALSTAHYRIRNAYDNPNMVERQLSGMAADGLLEKEGDVYRLSDKGLQFYNRMVEAMRPRWELPHEMESGVRRIIQLMQRLIESTANTPEPPSRWSFDTRRNKGIARPENTVLLEQFDWHIFDLWAYRDDVHLASWSGYPVTPFAWEALSLLWKNQWNTIEKLVEANSYREYNADEWGVFVAELVTQGWITANPDGTFTLTNTGKWVREAAEEKTDKTFYAPWSCLTASDLAELRDLLTRLRDKFSAIAES